MWRDDDHSMTPEHVQSQHHSMMQKGIYPVNAAFREYLRQYGRDIELPVSYEDLANYSYANSLRDKKGKWTHWENATYEPDQLAILKKDLIKTFLLLKKMPPGQAAGVDLERIDFCDFGNSIPFRVKMIIPAQPGYEFFYVKQADASRLYGLELEHLLTANPTHFLHWQNTLVEEHIGGEPGDRFVANAHQLTPDDKKAVAQAFVAFNESCFVRLLGDMRSYNFVIDSASGDKELPYRLRAIDFDQQCYEGRKAFYFPRFYKENAGFVELVLEHFSNEEIEQSRQSEFRSMAERIITHRRRLMELLNSMVRDDISENYKIRTLAKELNDHFHTHRFSNCKTMGAIVKQQLKQVLQKHVQRAKAR